MFDWVKRFLQFGDEARRTEYGDVGGIRDQAKPDSKPTLLLASAARIRSTAFAQAEVLGADDLGVVNWHELLYETFYNLYMEGRAFWRFRADNDGRPVIDCLSPNSVRRQGQMYAWDNLGRTELIDPMAMIMFTRYIKVRRAVDRLKLLMQTENAIYAGLAKASSDMAIRPRYVLTRPESPPPPPGKWGDLNKQVAEAMSSGVAVVHGNNTLTAMPISRDVQTPADLNEVRRAISADAGVPAPYLSSPDNQTYANLQALDVWFWGGTIIPEARTLSGQVRQQGIRLQPQGSRPYPTGLLRDFRLSYNAVPALRVQLEQQARAFAMLTRGGMEVDEARSLSGLDADAE